MKAEGKAFIPDDKRDRNEGEGFPEQVRVAVIFLRERHLSAMIEAGSLSHKKAISFRHRMAMRPPFCPRSSEVAVMVREGFFDVEIR
jgi:hypothetical protein